MSDMRLLLPSAKSGIIVDPRVTILRRWQIAAFVAGLFVVLVGAADLSSRAAQALLGSNAAALTFAPAVALSDPSVLSALQAASATSTVAGQLASTTPLIPARLKIPVIGVNANIQQVGKKADGTMGTPSNFTDVAWYEPGSQPGQPGNAVIDGHVDNALTEAGVFEHLSQMTLGDTIQVLDASGRTLTYAVTQVEVYPVDQAPTASIFATSGPSQLVLITCQGDWIPAEKSFNDRLVVTAALVN